MTDELQKLESIANEVIQLFDVKSPPVPVETMLQHPKEGMWKEVNVAQLTGSFLSFKDQYSPRMSMARLLARHIVMSEYGKKYDLKSIVTNEDAIRAFARMIIMPGDFINGINQNLRNPVAMSMQFEVPEEDAEQRLIDLDNED